MMNLRKSPNSPSLADLVCEVPAVGPAPGTVAGGAPVLFGSVAVAVLVPLLLLRGVVSKLRSASGM